jgi:hypothetical protein
MKQIKKFYNASEDEINRWLAENICFDILQIIPCVGTISTDDPYGGIRSECVEEVTVVFETGEAKWKPTR